jgi:ABC-type multidrug transport system fused ATPase/permease subunit
MRWSYRRFARTVPTPACSSPLWRLFVGIALLRAVGIVARRLGAGIMQYRLQASYRRRVTRQYLRLPLSWHNQHPTGQLLSNANSDVEATWFPIAPLPMAVGVLAMIVVAVIAMLTADLVLAVIGCGLSGHLGLKSSTSGCSPRW